MARQDSQPQLKDQDLYEDLRKKGIRTKSGTDFQRSRESWTVEWVDPGARLRGTKNGRSKN